MNITPAPRAYRQGARAEASAATGRRILDAFVARLERQWVDEIRLDDVAADADVTVQTVIRRFGGKEGLLAAMAERFGVEVQARRAAPAPGDWRGHVEAVFADYEISGRFVLRMLAQEERWPGLKPVLEFGRTGHCEIVARIHAPWFEPLAPDGRARLLAALVMLTDVQSWRLLRIDRGLSAPAAVAVTQRLVGNALQSAEKGEWND
jgi:AcrR family transcriptional regulator